MALHILLVEDKEALTQSKSTLLSDLKNEGYQVDVAYTTQMADNKIKTVWPDVILFNSNSANSQIELSAIIADNSGKKKLNIPCVILYSAGEPPNEHSKNVISVMSGDFQYLTSEIERATTLQPNRFNRLPGFVIDTLKNQIVRNKTCHHLTPRTLKLLCLLVDNQDEILSRKMIMKEVWETDYMGDTRTLDVHIHWIREKIEDNPHKPQRLVTIRGEGYRFNAEI